MSRELWTLVIAVSGATASIFAIAAISLGAKAAMSNYIHAGLHVPVWLKKRMLFFFAWTHRNKLFVETPDVSVAIPLQDISEIQYHCHEDVGLLSWFEFIYGEGRSLVLDASTRGVWNDVIPKLQTVLPGFGKVSACNCMASGSTEDTCAIWRA
jgi:hypothetical protein